MVEHDPFGKKSDTPISAAEDRKALAGGPTVLRVVGEMACVRSMFASDPEMMDYEEAYEVMARRFPVVTLCQYDAREFDGEVMLRALKAHPDMFVQHMGGFLN